MHVFADKNLLLSQLLRSSEKSDKHVSKVTKRRYALS